MQTPKKIEKIEKAFELYCANYKQTYIAKEFKVSRSTVSGWAKDYDWKNRKDERDKQDALKLREKIMLSKVKWLKAIDRTVDKYVDNLDKDLIKLEAVKDLETAVKLGLELDIPTEGIKGESDSSQVETVNGGCLPRVLIPEIQEIEKTGGVKDGKT